MSKGRVHYPHTAQAKHSAKVTRNPPNARGRYRRKAQPTHPGCSRTAAQHWTGLIVQWKAQGLSAEVVRATFGDSEDVVIQCAVTNYLKLARRNQL